MAKTERLYVFLVPVLACAAWTVFAGKDLNWDLLNYHYYLPFEFLAGRVEQDFYAASAQSYLNPLGYVPFYLMVASGWHSVLVSVVLAAVHSLSVALLYVIARRLFADLPEGERVVFSVLAAALGAGTAVFWATVGTSFLDPLLVPLVLAGVLLLLDPQPPIWRVALAGALFGTAAALKYSNAIYGVAAVPLALALPGLSRPARGRAVLAYAAGGLVAVALLAGPWFVLMIREFGNPVFPLMNGWFRSAYAPPVNMVSDRFTPHSLAAALALPFRMVMLDRHLYSEIFAPDVRLVAVLLTAVALTALNLTRRSRRVMLSADDWRLFGFFGASTVLWLASSANARYGMVVLLLAGVTLTRLVERLLPASSARVMLAVVLVVQVGLSAFAAPARWFIAEPWSRHWLPYKVPEQALRVPALYLTLEILPMAVVAPFVHRQSSFVNLRGQHSVPSDSPKLAALIERHRGHLRALGRGLLSSTGIPPADQVRAYDDTLRRIGYRLDTTHCFTIAWRPDEDEDALSRAANHFTDASLSPEPLSVASCRLVAAPRDPADIEAERRMSAVFARIEQRCPLLRGHTAVTEPFGPSWLRYYDDLDARLEAVGGRVVLDRFRTGEIVDLGPVSGWQRENGPLPEACRRRAAGNVRAEKAP